ncbi:MAG TPA: hypothetical protein VFQ85_12465 [Mycobacteriales bacterium]|jgi:hypothetical protein|nr:hypothetical protein [Mycobacteriales bacterium]
MSRSSLTRSTLLRTAAAVAAIAVTVPVGAGHAEDIPTAPCGTGGAVRKGAGNWQVLNAPVFSPLANIGAAPQDVLSYAVSPKNPKLVAVTNGKSIEVSRDGGCTWDEGLRLDAVTTDVSPPLSGATTTIRQVAITSAGRFIATAEELDTSPAVGRPHVLLSADGRRGSWRLGDNGLPPIGKPLVLRASTRNPNVVYLSFAQAREESTTGSCPPAPLPCPPGTGGGTGRSLGLLWGSTDGGTNWSNRTSPTDLNGVSAIRYYAIDDNNASGQVIWAVTNGRLRVSTNGGASYTEPGGLTQGGFDFTAVDVLRLGAGNKIDVLAFGSNGHMMRRQDGKWIDSAVSFSGVRSIAQLADRQIAVATDSERYGFPTVWRIRPQDFLDYDSHDGPASTLLKKTFGWQPITPAYPMDGDPALSSTVEGVSTFFARTKRAVLRFAGASIDRKRLLAPPADLVKPPAPRGRILPNGLTIELPLNGTRTIDYTLTLPPSPTPLEVFLLIDNSGSMAPLIDDLKMNLADVARALNRSGVDVRMGVGKINVQPENDQPPVDNPLTKEIDESKPVPLYELLRRIGPIDGTLFRALDTVDGNGGSGYEAQLESLYQLATGAGMSRLGLPAGLLGYSVPPKQQAGFDDSKDVIRVVIHATDEKFSTNIRNGHNVPQDVIAVLKNKGIKQIGLSQGVTAAHEDLAKVAKGTGALAPAAGVDCNGDGHIDLNPGTPLVCGQNYGLDKTLVNLLASLSDRQTISLYARRTETLRAVTRTAFDIDAKRATKQTFRVTFSCAGVDPGSYINELDAGLRGIQVARAITTVNCGRPDQRPIDGRGPGAPAGAVPENPQPLPQPNPPIVPAPPVQPISQPQTQVQSQSQMNPQAGMADQEQEQFQLAAADNDTGPGDDGATADELAMTGLDRADTRAPGAAAVYGAGLAMTAVCGVALRRRTRTQYARAFVTRR